MSKIKIKQFLALLGKGEEPYSPVWGQSQSGFPVLPLLLHKHEILDCVPQLDNVRALLQVTVASANLQVLLGLLAAPTGTVRVIIVTVGGCRACAAEKIVSLSSLHIHSAVKHPVGIQSHAAV